MVIGHCHQPYTKRNARTINRENISGLNKSRIVKGDLRLFDVVLLGFIKAKVVKGQQNLRQTLLVFWMKRGDYYARFALKTTCSVPAKE